MLFSNTMSIFDPIMQCTSVFCIVLADFMSKNCKHFLIQKVTFSTKKELLTQPYTREPSINAQNLCVHQSNNAVFTHPFS